MLLAAIGSLYVSSAFAGPLADDTNTVDGIWHYSTPFQTYVDHPNTDIPDTMSGHVDWAVYGPTRFPAGFTGYIPDPTEWVYAFQLFVDAGSASRVQLNLPLDSFAHGLGTFIGNAGFGDISGIGPSDAYLSPNAFTPTEFVWTFEDVPPVFHSRGFASSAPFSRPILVVAGIFGASADGTDEKLGFIAPLPTSGDYPEPSSFVLAALGLIGLAVWRRRKR